MCLVDRPVNLRKRRRQDDHGAHHLRHVSRKGGDGIDVGDVGHPCQLQCVLASLNFSRQGIKFWVLVNGGTNQFHVIGQNDSGGWKALWRCELSIGWEGEHRVEHRRILHNSDR